MAKYTGHLHRCPYCGVEEAEESHKFPGRCVVCGDRYNRYSVYKSLQKKDFSFKREALLEQIRYEYRCLKQAGYRVPKDIE